MHSCLLVLSPCQQYADALIARAPQGPRLSRSKAASPWKRETPHELLLTSWGYLSPGIWRRLSWQTPSSGLSADRSTSIARRP